MSATGINAAPSQKDILHVVQRTNQSHVIFLCTYPLTHQASELFLSIADCGYRNWTLSSLRITFEDKLEIVRMLRDLIATPSHQAVSLPS
jgi:gamma-glutamylcysteine synthetase